MHSGHDIKRMQSYMAAWSIGCARHLDSSICSATSLPLAAQAQHKTGQLNVGPFQFEAPGIWQVYSSSLSSSLSPISAENLFFLGNKSCEILIETK